MKSYSKFGVVICVIALSLSAFAGSVTTFRYSTPLSGVPNTTVYGTFSYNVATHAFTSESLSFVGNSIFGGLHGTVTQPQFGSSFVFNQAVAGYNVSYNILLDVSNPGSYTADGYITNGGKPAMFAFRKQVPEGGSQVSYLFASGLALLAGMLLAGKQRRRPAVN